MESVLIEYIISDQIDFVNASHEFMPLPKIGIVLPMISLRGTVKKIFKDVDGLKSNTVYGPS